MEEKRSLAPDKPTSEPTKLRRIPERLLLMIVYGLLSFFIGFLLAGGPEGRGAVEPLAFLTSWATVFFFFNSDSDLAVLLLVLFLYLIFILVLNTILAKHGKSWLKIIPIIIHGAGGFVAISMVDPAYGFGGWQEILAGLATFWAYLAFDWRLARSKKSRFESGSW